MSALAAVIQSVSGGVILSIRVVPRAARAGVAGVRDATLLVRLNAPPVDGAANAELIDLLSDTFDVPKRAITIQSGERGRVKRVQISGVDAQQVERAWASLVDPGRPASERD